MEKQIKEEFTGQTMTEEEWQREIEKIAKNTYQQFLAIGLRTVIKITPQYALLGFRLNDLSKAIEDRSMNKVQVKTKAKDLGIWITIMPNRSSGVQTTSQGSTSNGASTS